MKVNALEAGITGPRPKVLVLETQWNNTKIISSQCQIPLRYLNYLQTSYTQKLYFLQLFTRAIASA